MNSSSPYSPRSSNDGESSPMRSKNCRYKEICNDLRERLRCALDQIDVQKNTIEVLQRELSDSKSTIEQIRCEKNQIAAQIATYEEHISIIKTKNSVMKQKLSEMNGKDAQIEDLERLNESLTSKLHRKNEKLKSVAEYLETNDFDAVAEENAQLKQELEELNEELANKQTLEIQNQKLLRENANYSERIAMLEEDLKDSGSVHNQLSTVTRQLKAKDSETQELEKETTELTVKYERALQMIEELQSKVSQMEFVQQRNDQMKKRIEEFTQENQQLYEQLESAETLRARVSELETCKRSLESTLSDATSANTKLQEELARQLKVVPLPQRSEADIARISDLTKQVESLREDLVEYNATRIERDQLLQDVTTLESKVIHLKDADARNVELTLKLDSLMSQLGESAMRESRHTENINRLMNDRKELERVRNKLLRIEDEVNERETKEQQMRSQINFYKAQVREQKVQINNYEEQLHVLRNEMFKLRQVKDETERELERSTRKHKKVQKEKSSLVKQLDSERMKNLSYDTELQEMKHKFERYQTAFEFGK